MYVCMYVCIQSLGLYGLKKYIFWDCVVGNSQWDNGIDYMDYQEYFPTISNRWDHIIDNGSNIVDITVPSGTIDIPN